MNSIKYLIIMIASVFLMSCDKKYTFVSMTESKDYLGNKTAKAKVDYIKAPNDTMAYLKAYEEYMLSLGTYYTVVDLYDKIPDKPFGFKLYVDEYTDLSELQFESKYREEQKIKERMRNIYQSIEYNPTGRVIKEFE